MHTVATGRWLPDEGLQVWVVERPETVRRLDLNDATELRLPAGDQTVELFRGEGRPFPAACSVDGGRRRDVTIRPDQSALAQFELFCEVVLELDLMTDGVNLDPDGYRVLVGPEYAPGDDRFPVYELSPNGSLTLDRDSPFWWDENPFLSEERRKTRVYLWDEGPNCTVIGANPLVLATGGGVTTAQVLVECVDPLPVSGTLYFLSGSDVFRMAVNGGIPEQLTDGPRIHFFALSPDGTEIIFEPRSDGSLNRVGIDGTGLTTIVPDDGYASHDLHWGVDGRLLFTRIDLSSFSSDVYSVNPDGSDLRRLTTDGGEQPALSPDGSTIAYAGPDGLMLMEPDGSNQRPVPGGIELWKPTWSPDGSLIAGGAPGSSSGSFYRQIVLVDPATGVIEPVARRLLQSLSQFAWSPDGGQLVFSAASPASNEPFPETPGLFTVSTEGLNQARVAQGFWADQLDWRE